MKKLLLFFFGIVCFISVAQNDKTFVDDLVLKFAKSLENKQVNDYLFVYKYCNGTTKMFKLRDGSMCVSKGTYYEVYFFWEEENQTMIKKIDNCGLYFSMPLNNSEIIDFINNNIEKLEEEKVKKYEVKNPENVPTLRTEIHSCNRIFQFVTETNSFIQSYNLYDLTNESKYKNLNFEYNNNLEIITLDKVIESTISEMESKFKRQF